MNFPKKVLLLSVFRLLLLLVENVPRNRVPVFDLSLSLFFSALHEIETNRVYRELMFPKRVQREREKSIWLVSLIAWVSPFLVFLF